MKTNHILTALLFVFPVLAQAKFKEHAKDGIKDQYIVQLKDDGSLNNEKSIQDKSDQLAKNHGGQRIKPVYKKTIKGFVAKMNSAQARKLSEEASVEYVEQDMHVQISQAAGATWGLDRIDQTTGPLDGAYQPSYTGTGVHAYVIDSGIRITHSEFQGRADVAFDAIKDGNLDCHGHGTHVAGTIGGATYGVAKNVYLHAARVFGCTGGGQVSDMISAIDWITAHGQRPAVTNISMTVSGISNAMESAIEKSISSGVTYVVAAANYNMDACLYSPAHAPNAITVGATYFDAVNNKDIRAGYSNWGTCLDIFAPGNGITSAAHWDDVSPRGMSGTSMASPHVAGVAALFLETNPTASPAEVASALKRDAISGIVDNIGVGSPNLFLNAKISPETPCGRTSPQVAIIGGGVSISPGSTGTFTVEVTNKNSALCSAETFNLSSVVPVDWIATFAQPQLTIASGAKQSTTVNVAVPTTAVLGIQSVRIIAQTERTPVEQSSAATSVTVAANSLTVTTNATYPLGSRISITGRLTQNGIGVSGKTVNFVITKPNGSTVNLKGTTNTSGVVVVTYRQGRKDPRGTYSVRATSSVSGPILTGTTTFIVN